MGTAAADRGLQAERTALAWQRTGLAASVASLVALRDGIVTGSVAVIGLAVVALVAALFLLGRSRVELPSRVAALRAGAPLPAPAAVPAALVCLLGLAAATLGILINAR